MAVVAIACMVSAVSVAQQPAGQISVPRTTALPLATQMHASVVLGKRIYVMGGHNGVWSNKVWSAEIQDATGHLGTWRAERDMPDHIAYIGTSCEVVNNRIYVIAGAMYPAGSSSDDISADYAKSALWTTVQPDGTLAEWQRSPEFPGVPVTCAASCSTDRHLFLIGGYHRRQVLDQILVADLGVNREDYVDADAGDAGDGGPGNWRHAGKLPMGLWFHGAALLDNRMYVWGGLIGRGSDSVSGKTFSAPVDKDGTVGQWRDETPMPHPIYSAGYCGFNDHLFCISGRYLHAQPTNVVWYAKLTESKVGQWNMLATDLDARVFHAIGFDRARGVVYVTGGQKRLVAGQRDAPPVINTVQAFRLSQPQSARLELAKPSGEQKSAGAITDLDQALLKAREANSSVLALFYSPEVPACKRFWDGVVNTPEFKELSKPFVFAAIDTSRDGSKFQYKYGVFKLPCLAEIAPDRKMKRYSISLMTIGDAKAMLSKK